ncbi:MAG TPA: transglutaminase domain-containing protein [Candidatus Nanoarchaeia archaeon]|nr:transglutaminase domain-containing protein [Candidatus Nanoarchaeia archaeon]
MLKRILLFLLLAIPLAAAQADENYEQYDGLSMKVVIGSKIDFSLRNPSGSVRDLNAELAYLPLDDPRQSVKILGVETNPKTDYRIDGRNLIINWDNPGNDWASYEITAQVDTKNDFTKISRKASFPADINGKELEYTKASKYIDLNSDIEALALKLSQGKDDLWDVTFTIAEWTRTNIKYDLNTLTAAAVQPSSWVLKNKEGVCDEMTNLFISMMRSLGIPARFVSGVVYSNAGNNPEWGGHGWAEVYFPGYGWVPFDVTFGQYGWLDPSHIKLKDDMDSGTPSATYTWSADDVDIEVGPLDIETSLIDAEGEKQSPVTFSVEPMASRVKFGSYVPIEVSIENQEDYYVSVPFVVVTAPGLEESNLKTILLKPNERGKLFWIVKIPDGLNNDYVYTAKIEVKDGFGNKEGSSIEYSATYELFSKEKAEKLVNSLTRQDTKNSYKSLDFSCRTSGEIYYEGDEAIVECSLKNKGSKMIEFEVCLKIDCESVSLGSGEETILTFNYVLSEAGRIVAVASNDDFTNYAYLDLNVISVPKIEISDVAPLKVNYNEIETFKFTIESSEKIQDVKIQIDYGGMDLGDLEGKQTITFESNTKYLLDGLNFKIDYKDMAGKSYTHNENVKLEVMNTPWYAKILFRIFRLFQ